MLAIMDNVYAPWLTISLIIKHWKPILTQERDFQQLSTFTGIKIHYINETISIIETIKPNWTRHPNVLIVPTKFGPLYQCNADPAMLTCDISPLKPP